MASNPNVSKSVEILIGNAGGDGVLITSGASFDSESWTWADIRVRCDGWRGGIETSLMRGEL